MPWVQVIHTNVVVVKHMILVHFIVIAHKTYYHIVVEHIQRLEKPAISFVAIFLKMVQKLILIKEVMHI